MGVVQNRGQLSTEDSINDGNEPRQSGYDARRQSTPLHDVSHGNGFTEVQNMHGVGPDYADLLHQDIGAGTFSHEQLRKRNIAREKAHNAQIMSSFQNRKSNK